MSTGDGVGFFTLVGMIQSAVWQRYGILKSRIGKRYTMCLVCSSVNTGLSPAFTRVSFASFRGGIKVRVIRWGGGERN